MANARRGINQHKPLPRDWHRVIHLTTDSWELLPITSRMDFAIINFPRSLCRPGGRQAVRRLTAPPPCNQGKATYPAVRDIQAARRELTEHGVDVGGIRHKSAIGDWTATGNRVSVRSADFAGPDDNTWAIQEIGCHPQDTAVANEVRGLTG